MAAITKRLLYPRPNFHSYARLYPYPQFRFSSSSNPDNRSDIPQPEPVGKPDSSVQTESPFSSYFNEVKSSLQKEPPPQNRHQSPSKAFSFSSRNSPPPSRADSIDEIRRNLSEFRIRSAAPPPSSSAPTPSSSGGQFISFQELYERNVTSKAEHSATSSGFTSNRSFDAIRGSLRQLNPSAQTAMNRNDSGGKPSGPRSSLSRITESWKLKADPNADLDSTMLTGGSKNLTSRKGTMGKGYGNLSRTLFGRTYDHLDLGKKLKMLRPEKRKGKWFSLQELSDRIAKLKENEDKEDEKRLGGVMKDLRDGLVIAAESENEKAAKVKSKFPDSFSFSLRNLFNELSM